MRQVSGPFRSEQPAAFLLFAPGDSGSLQLFTQGLCACYPAKCCRMVVRAPNRLPAEWLSPFHVPLFGTHGPASTDKVYKPDRHCG
jgi:hypothetical protein